MRGSRVGVLVVVVAVGACARQSTQLLTGDAGTDAATPDATLPYSISIGASTVTASPVMPRTVSITGPAGVEVAVTLDRTSAGVIDPTTITLAPNGTGTVAFAPCPDVSPGCLGPATLSLALASGPGNAIAQAPITLEAPAEVGEVAPCLTGGNVLYLRGNDGVFSGVLQTDSGSAWNVVARPDQIQLDVSAGADHHHGIFSLVELAEPLAPGIYEGGQRAGYEAPGHPGIDVFLYSSGCSTISGRYKVHDYTADPDNGTVYAATISFEQVCDGMPAVLEGCFHYETPPPVSVAPPSPDPTMVSVQVLSTSGDGTLDLGATAIFTDTTGVVVLDSQVDAYGEAQASLPDGGEVTIIQNANGYEILTTYRGLTTGDHVVINPRAPRTGAADVMLANLVPPTSSSGIALVTACGGGNWPGGTAPDRAELTFYDGCRTPTFDMLSIAWFSGGEPQQFAWQTGLTHLANGNVSGPTSWAPMGTATLTLANVPAGSTSMTAKWSTMVGATTALMDGVAIDSPIAGDQAVTFTYAPGAGDATVVEVDSYYNPTLSESRSATATGAPSSITVDFATQPIPVVSATQQTTTGATWTETAGGTADVRTVYWRATLSSGMRTTWTLVEPYDGQAGTTLPSLPAAHAAQDPTSDAGAQLYGASVTYVDYDTASGFRFLPPSGDYHSHRAAASTYNMISAY